MHALTAWDLTFQVSLGYTFTPATCSQLLHWFKVVAFLNKHLMIALLGWWGGGGNLPSTYFGAIGFFNEADTLESSSILIIYAELRAGLYTQ
jgi:hypothetical protein